MLDTVTPRHPSSTVNDPSRRAEPVWQEDDTASWRAVWQFTQRRWRNDTRTLNKQRERAMSIIEGTISPKKARFVSGGDPKALTFNETTWQRANAVAGLTGYVTNIPARPSITPQAQHILDALNIPGGMTH